MLYHFISFFRLENEEFLIVRNNSEWKLIKLLLDFYLKIQLRNC